MMRAVPAIAAVVIGAAAAAVIAGSSRWDRATAGQLAAMAAAATAVEPCSTEGLRTLPPPVFRFIQSALPGGRPCVSSITLTQDAEMFMNGSWRPLEATQHYTVSPPGFVWDARIQMAPLMPVRVRDEYVCGRGALRASVLGVYTVADQAASPELNAGELQRFLGEAVWFPSALLPTASLTWQPRDDRSAVASLHDGNTTVSLIFEFDGGRITTIRGTRYKEDHGSYSLQPWLIRCSEHAQRYQMTIPLQCEVSWVEGGEPVPYWRGRITGVSYGYN
jgi:hypothetical protein